jgi:hypothetical protein
MPRKAKGATAWPKLPECRLERDLTGVRGWLLLYTIGPASFGFIAALAQVAELWRYGGEELEWLIGIALFLAYSAGLYMLIAARNPFTRLYHIGLTGFMAAALAVLAISTRDPAAAASCAGMSVWVVYWTRSKRVRQTYSNNATQNE